MERTEYPVWLRLLSVLSGTAYTILLMQTRSKQSFLVTAAAALVLLLVLVFRFRLLERLTENRTLWLWLLAGLLSCMAVYKAKGTFSATCGDWLEKGIDLLGLPGKGLLLRGIPWAAALAALPMAMCYFQWFLNFFWELAKRLWKTSDFTERFFFLTAGLLFAMMIVFTYLCTQAFYGAHVNGHWYNFDLIYSADSGYLVHTDVYRNVGADQNDLRQPLYGLFAMPFAHMAWLVSRLFWFLPEPFITTWQIIQMLLFLVSLILLSRMMKLQRAEKALFLTMISLCWPTLIFVLTAEQYLMAMFYLMLLLYLEREPLGQSLSFIGATGSLLTSGFWFPLVTWDRDLRKFIRKSLMLCGAFVAVVILCGRLTTFLDMPEYILLYGPYTGASVPLIEKLMQYVNFAGACVIAPPSGPDTTTYSHISWQMLPVTGWSPVGIGVLLLTAGGIGLSWRDRLTKCALAWILFSFLMLGIVGWGTVDNGLSLYSLYFGWAFAAMIFRLAERGLSRVRPVKLVVLAAICLVLAVVNVFALRSVLVFGSQFFPSLGV